MHTCADTHTHAVLVALLGAIDGSESAQDARASSHHDKERHNDPQAIGDQVQGHQGAQIVVTDVLEARHDLESEVQNGLGDRHGGGRECDQHRGTRSAEMQEERQEANRHLKQIDPVGSMAM